jgi:positive regulator of sigma E activity
MQTGRLLTEDEIVKLTNEEGAWLVSTSVMYLEILVYYLIFQFLKV